MSTITMVSGSEESPTIEYLVEHYGSMVTALCRRMIQNEETARDAAQEVWLELMKSLPTFRHASKVSTWLYTIAHRVIMRYAINERTYQTQHLSGYFHGDKLELPHHVDFDKELWVKEMCDKCLTGILHCLDDESRLAYIFRDMAELTYTDIATILGREEPAVRKMISRARNKLKNFLSDECMLSNPDSKCKCRMSPWVADVGLDEAYTRLRSTVHRANVYKSSQTLMPGKNFWLHAI